MTSSFLISKKDSTIISDCIKIFKVIGSELKLLFFFLLSGYNDILLIPAGATNIKVKEIQPTNNYLGT